MKTIKIFVQALLIDGVMTPKDATVSFFHKTTYALVSEHDVTIGSNGIITVPDGPLGEHFASVKGKGFLETVSAEPFENEWDFTTSADKAYGSNQVRVNDNVFAAFSGDVNEDGSINQTDLDLLDTDIENSVVGNVATDLNGDEVVDNSDSTPLINNLGKQVMRPVAV